MGAPNRTVQGVRSGWVVRRARALALDKAAPMANCSKCACTPS
jgi:hypothetical protein